MIPYLWLEQAADRIAAHILKTPVTYDRENDLYLKWENRQVTGSFKIRGALNKVLALQDWERQRGLVTSSAGNHGQGVAWAARLVGAPVTIFVSDHAIPAKLEAMRSLGADLRLVQGGYGEAEQAGLQFAQESGATWISPYNNAQVIAGQGTLGIEIMQELPDLQKASWIVPVGGGGLISGIGAALHSEAQAAGDASSRKEYFLIGVQSEASPFFHAIYKKGDQSGAIELPSLADGLSGPVEDNSLTIPLVRSYVDDIILVTEEEIAEAIAFSWQRYGERIEGSAAAALAAVIYDKIRERPAVVIISGGNIQPETHREIITR